MNMKMKRLIAGISALALTVSAFGFAIPERVSITGFAEEASDEEAFTQYVKYTVTEEELAAAGVKWQGSSKATVYVKMTEGGADSKINTMLKLGPDGDDGQPVGKASSKYLSGRNVGSGNAIQDNLVGDAGTGIYAFPELSFNKSVQNTATSTWQSSYANEVTITVRIDTPNTDCELLGIKFSNGAVYNVSSDYDVSKVTTESASYDVVATSSKELLKNTLDYCDTMDSSKYQSDSWAKFQTELEKARAVYNKSGVTNDECASARASLEKVKANMLFADTNTEENPLSYRDLTNDEIVEEMGVGINLGNTMDGHSGFTPGETLWQISTTTKAYINALHDAGYNTVRIPVTWGTMIDDENGYSINENWLNRVQEIVDYCVSQDMYAIINIHHDGAEESGWLYVGAEDIDAVYEKFECVWRNIAERFKDYDEHLIFESMNEITGSSENKNTTDQIEADTPIIMNLNQIFVNVVRSTGSNNTKRWLASVAHYANGGTNSSFSLPTDSYNSTNRLMFASHIYKSSNNSTFTYDDLKPFVSNLQKMSKKFNVPIILGEYGTTNQYLSGSDTGYNDEYRAWYCEIVSRACKVAGVVPCVWDQNYGSEGNKQKGLFTYWDRETCTPVFENIVDAMIRGYYADSTSKNLKYDFSDVAMDPTIIPITEMELSDETVTVELDDNYQITSTVSPSNNNDVVLWSTDDDTIATVYNGKIRARGVGITTVNAYTQNGDVVKEVTVKVVPKETDNPVTAINAENCTVMTGKSVSLNASVEPADADSQLTYKSSNTEVATVDALGKVFGVKAGTAYITITASSGITKTVKVVVSDTVISDEMNLALHVLYNDDSHKYYGCETGTAVTVNGDGQYTVTFNLDTDLSKAGKSAGITEVNNLTAIYIKDIDVTNGDLKSSSVTSGQIRYDSVKLNGVEQEIKNTSFGSIMNGSVVDTGGPINAWHSPNFLVGGYTASNYVATFTDVKNVTTVEVTFTLQDLEFVQASDTEENPAISLKADSDVKTVMAEPGMTETVSVKVVPKATDSTVTFVSSDASVVGVDTTSVSFDPETGLATVQITALDYGKVTLSAMTENGYSVDFTVIVGEDDEDTDNDDDNNTEEPDDTNPPVDGDEGDEGDNGDNGEEGNTPAVSNPTESTPDSNPTESTPDSNPVDSNPVDSTPTAVTSSQPASEATSSTATTESKTDTSSKTADTASKSTDSGSKSDNPNTGAGTFAMAGILLTASAITVSKKKK